VGNNPPENSSGEAATFPEALDTTNKKESIWSVWPLSGMIAKVPQNSGFCTSGQDRGGGERIGSALADSVSAWPGCEVGIRVVLGRRRPVYVRGFG
jgi:hypothetical protein